MRPDDRDILFGDRFGGWDGDAEAGPWPMPGVEIDALMDAYFDGEISDDDRVRLFGLLRRDPDRCLQFVEMQRTALLLERAPAGPDQTESILNSLGRYQASQGAPGGRYRIGPRVMRGAIAAAVMFAGAGLVMLGQLGPPGGSSRAQQPGAFERAPEMASSPASIDAPADAAPSAIASSSPAPAGRPALRPGELRSLGATLARDSGQIETPTRGLAGREAGSPPTLVMEPGLTLDPAPGASGFDRFEGFNRASPREIRRLMGFTYGGYTPWGVYGVWGETEEMWDPPQPAPKPERPR